MRYRGRFLAAVLLLGSASGVAQAAGMERSLGVVDIAEQARVDGNDISKGADFFAGQDLATGEGGVLQVRVQSGRIQMGAFSDATVLPDTSPSRLQIIRGSVRFSEPANGGFVIGTPAGILRGAEGHGAAGMVVIHDANNMEISAYGEDLILDNDGELHLIPAGRSYRVEVREAPANSSSPVAGYHPPRRKLALYMIGGAVAVFAEYEIWNHGSERPYKRKC